ncbi:MAG TPA: hypothetical protein VJ781_09260 [Pyrinomonadaceae bacterium]|jgi:hypothetical protein|nr:hypothetical protein [Pyrinomonadaceae bacterium]
MKIFGFFSLAFTALAFLLWLGSFAYWNYFYTISEFWSTTYVLMLGVTLLAGICGFLALTTLSIGLILGAKKAGVQS